jgi:hypothetical protein
MEFRQGLMGWSQRMDAPAGPGFGSIIPRPSPNMTARKCQQTGWAQSVLPLTAVPYATFDAMPQLERTAEPSHPARINRHKGVPTARKVCGTRLGWTHF